MFKAMIRNSKAWRIFSLLRDYRSWAGRDFAAPSPHYIKQSCLIRNGHPHAIWVETGTYLGQTTKILSQNSVHVYSIEPEPTLFANAKQYFSNVKNVEIINGTSESDFPTLLPKLKGNINFWLDGHYSAGATFKGAQDTPIVDELNCISKNIKNFDKICVLVDDIRCFNPEQPEYSTYPSIDFLVDWARNHNLNWHIEHDIFVAKNP